MWADFCKGDTKGASENASKTVKAEVKAMATDPIKTFSAFAANAVDGMKPMDTPAHAKPAPVKAK